MADWQSVHEVQDNNRHEENIAKFDVIGSALHEIKTNHLRHLEDDTTTLVNASTKQSTDIWWIKWLVMGLVGGIGLVIVGILINYFSIVSHT